MGDAGGDAPDTEALAWVCVRANPRHLALPTDSCVSSALLEEEKRQDVNFTE